MKIALATWSVREAGGVESYVGDVANALAVGGHSVSVWYEEDVPLTRRRLLLGPGITTHQIPPGSAGPTDAELLPPDVVLLNGLARPATERAIVDHHPTVFVAHDYHGTCVSGTKTWSSPDVRPCARAFGIGCLALYFPRRCGGRSPLTMLRLYTRESRRLAAVQLCRFVVTYSEHMRQDYLRQGLSPDRVLCFPYGPRLDPIPSSGAAGRGLRADLRLLVVGRLERQKGVHLAIAALPYLAACLGRQITLIVAGDGREREALVRQSKRVAHGCRAVRVEFRGWLSRSERDEAMRDADLLIVPSVWAEPFGMVGVEAGRRGLPAAAFRVGGISDWLTDGVNGALASATPPTAAGLADAVARCVTSASRHAELSRAARDNAQRFTTDGHVAGLLALFEQVAAVAREAAV